MLVPTISGLQQGKCLSYPPGCVGEVTKSPNCMGSEDCTPFKLPLMHPFKILSLLQGLSNSLYIHLLNISKSSKLVVEECLHTLEWPIRSTVSTIPLLSYCQFRIIHHFSVSYALHNKYHKHAILKLFKKLTINSPVLSMTKLVLCSIAWGYNYVIIIIHNLVYICGCMDASS